LDNRRNLRLITLSKNMSRPISLSASKKLRFAVPDAADSFPLDGWGKRLPVVPARRPAQAKNQAL
jgi:hypothetical protein